MTNQTIYTVGGTVQAGGGVYIPRKADDELLGYCRASEFAFILSSRQVGKSSLMVRTARQLESENIRSVIIDLSSIGVKISADEWYLGILDEIATALNLKTDIFLWWSERTGLGPAQRMTNFFRDILLKEVTELVVVFFDEIDSTLSIPFADDFFAALRAIYNTRSTVADFKRLSFVMIGVATPSDLIADSTRTPFNIGRRVELTDFTLEELHPLAEGLGENAEQILKWVFDWTNGHPYLTQRLCQFLTKSRDGITQEMVETAVKNLFLGEKGWEDNNLQFVRDMLLERAADKTGVLKTYQQIIKDKKPVEDNEQSLNKSHLKLSGVVRRRQANLSVSNLIYQNVFDLNWVKEHLPRLGWMWVLAITVLIGFGAGLFFQLDNLTKPVGRVFFSDRNALMDKVAVTISNLPKPKNGSHYEVWLLAQGGENRRNIGKVTIDKSGQGQMQYWDPDQKNILSLFDQLEVTVEADNSSNPNKSSGDVIASSVFPPLSLVHVRNILYSFPAAPEKTALIQGLWYSSDWLYSNAGDLQKALSQGDEKLFRLKTEEIINLMVGNTNTNQYIDWNKDGFINDLTDGFGLLQNGDQGYIPLTMSQAQLAAQTTDATENIKTQSANVVLCLENIKGWSEQLLKKALQVQAMPFGGDMEPLIAEMKVLSDQIVSGIDTNGNSLIEPIAGEGGATTAYEYAYYMADMPLLPGANRIPVPAPTPR
jgi:hypothetical protein